MHPIPLHCFLGFCAGECCAQGAHGREDWCNGAGACDGREQWSGRARRANREAEPERSVLRANLLHHLQRMKVRTILLLLLLLPPAGPLLRGQCAEDRLCDGPTPAPLARSVTLYCDTLKLKCHRASAFRLSLIHSKRGRVRQNPAQQPRRLRIDHLACRRRDPLHNVEASGQDRRSTG